MSPSIDGATYREVSQEREDSEDEAMSAISANDSEDDRQCAGPYNTPESARKAHEDHRVRPSQNCVHVSQSFHFRDGSNSTDSYEKLSTDIDDLDLLKNCTPQTTIFGYPARMVQQWAEAKDREQGRSFRSCTSTSADPLDCLS